MKVEEIKLAFETNVKFALVDEYNKKLVEAQKGLQEALDMNKSATYKADKAFSLASEVAGQLERNIAQAKELGLDYKPLTGISQRADAIQTASVAFNKKHG